MYVLGIESTCDETACAIVKEGQTILSNVIASQVETHKDYGGVVPELACRRHIDLIMPVIDQALKQANLPLEAMDLIAVAHGPGLIGALLIGLNTAKALAFALNKPLVGVNHLEAHLYAALLSKSVDQTLKFPCLGVVASGGHTALVLIKAWGLYELIGETVDDAIGEAFDKVAKLLDLPYPGGPEIEQLARQGDSKRYPLKAGVIKGYPFKFSFSGLKTAVLYTVRDLPTLSFQEKCDLAASFQQTALDDLVKKTLLAAHHYQVSTIIFGGGVTNNQYLRQLFNQKNQTFDLIWPTGGLSLDNAAMIAGLGYHQYLAKGNQGMDLEPLTRIPFSEKTVCS
jgi:N6-L-threonylcarbamoyladenine synthase